MAYQVTPWSLIAVFRPWLAEIAAPSHIWKKALSCLDVRNSLQHVRGWSVEPCLRFSFDCQVQGQQSALSTCSAVILPYLSLWRLSSWVEFLQHFLTFSAPSSTDRLIHAWMLQCPLIQSYWVMFGGGLLSRSSQTHNWFSITTTNKQQSFEAHLLIRINIIIQCRDL